MGAFLKLWGRANTITDSVLSSWTASSCGPSLPAHRNSIQTFTACYCSADTLLYLLPQLNCINIQIQFTVLNGNCHTPESFMTGVSSAETCSGMQCSLKFLNLCVIQNRQPTIAYNRYLAKSLCVLLVRWLFPHGKKLTTLTHRRIYNQLARQ